MCECIDGVIHWFHVFTTTPINYVLILSLNINVFLSFKIIFKFHAKIFTHFQTLYIQWKSFCFCVSRFAHNFISQLYSYLNTLLNSFLFKEVFLKFHKYLNYFSHFMPKSLSLLSIFLRKKLNTNLYLFWKYFSYLFRNILCLQYLYFHFIWHLFKGLQNIYQKCRQNRNLIKCTVI